VLAGRPDIATYYQKKERYAGEYFYEIGRSEVAS